MRDILNELFHLLTIEDLTYIIQEQILTSKKKFQTSLIPLENKMPLSKFRNISFLALALIHFVVSQFSGGGQCAMTCNDLRTEVLTLQMCRLI
jgi:hypothetical protein